MGQIFIFNSLNILKTGDHWRAYLSFQSLSLSALSSFYSEPCSSIRVGTPPRLQEWILTKHEPSEILDHFCDGTFMCQLPRAKLVKHYSWARLWGHSAGGHWEDATPVDLATGCFSPPFLSWECTFRPSTLGASLRMKLWESNVLWRPFGPYMWLRPDKAFIWI